MKQVFRLYLSRYLDTKSVALCLALIIGSSLLFTDYCMRAGI